MEESTKRLGKFFTAGRKAKGLTQAEAASLIRCSITDLSRYESGHKSPKLGRALIMCQVYGKSANQMAQAMDVAVEE